MLTKANSWTHNQHGEMDGHVATEDGKPMDFEDWIKTERAEKSFAYDVGGATESDLVIYIGPSGTDAWAEVGAAWASGVPIVGLYAKGEPSGLMRKMVTWTYNFRDLLEAVRDETVCDHDWVSARNKVIQDGYICLKCYTVRNSLP